MRLSVLDVLTLTRCNECGGKICDETVVDGYVLERNSVLRRVVWHPACARKSEEGSSAMELGRFSHMKDVGGLPQ